MVSSKKRRLRFLSPFFGFWWPRPPLSRAGCHGEYLANILQDPAVVKSFQQQIKEKQMAENLLVPDRFCNADCRAKVSQQTVFKIEYLPLEKARARAGAPVPSPDDENYIASGSFLLGSVRFDTTWQPQFLNFGKKIKVQGNENSQPDYQPQQTLLTGYRHEESQNLLNPFLIFDKLFGFPRLTCVL
jgi:hypothetical protein